MLHHKQIELTRWNNSDQEKFKKAFGTTEADARTLIQERIAKMIDYNKNLTVNDFSPIEPNHNKNVFAYVHGWEDHGKIYLGNKFWTESQLSGDNSIAGVLSHEESHAYNIGATKDGFDGYEDGQDIYYKNNSHKLAQERPDLALHHADSYEYYLEDQ